MSRYLDFATDANKRVALLAALDNPILAEAFSVADDMMEPKVGTQADIAPAVAAAKMHQVAGKNQFKDYLKRLTREPTKRERMEGRSLAERAEDIPKDFK